MALYTVHGQSHGHVKNKGTRGCDSRVPMLRKGGHALQVSVTRKPNAAQLAILTGARRSLALDNQLGGNHVGRFAFRGVRHLAVPLP
jgi:hypothetical protein